MKRIFEDYFYFTQAEKRGIIILLISSFLFCFIPFLYPYFYKETPTDFTAFQEALYTQSPKIEKDSASNPSPILFNFDPNSASQDEFVQLGIAPKVASTIINYRNKGGTFRVKKDLQKIYGLHLTAYNRLEPYINIQPTKKRNTFQPSEKPKHEKSDSSSQVFETPLAMNQLELIKIDINKATAREWQGLKGIGPVFSKRIIKFREKLGGFYNVEQVAETYGLPDSTFRSIKSNLVHSEILRPLPINTINEEDLKAHPYLNWKEAKALIKFRRHNGPFKTVADLEECYALKKETIQRLAPYLRFQ